MHISQVCLCAIPSAQLRPSHQPGWHSSCVLPFTTFDSTEAQRPTNSRVLKPTLAMPQNPVRGTFKRYSWCMGPPLDWTHQNLEQETCAKQGWPTCVQLSWHGRREAVCRRLEVELLLKEKRGFQLGSVMLNFMCQPDWAMGSQVCGWTFFWVCVGGCFWM